MHIFVYRRDQNGIAQHVLILKSRALGIIGIFLKEHGAHNGQASIAVTGIDVGRACRSRVDIRHQLALDLEVHAIDAVIGISVCIRRFQLASPTIHVQHDGRKRFPLIITRSKNRILSVVDSIHIRADVRIARQARADIGRNMETNILPVAFILVAGPNAGIALGARPAVERNDIGALASLCRHDFVCLPDAVQGE